jgi:hypothetical protein
LASTCGRHCPTLVSNHQISRPWPLRAISSSRPSPLKSASRIVEYCDGSVQPPESVQVGTANVGPHASMYDGLASGHWAAATPGDTAKVPAASTTAATTSTLDTTRPAARLTLHPCPQIDFIAGADALGSESATSSRRRQNHPGDSAVTPAVTTVTASPSRRRRGRLLRPSKRRTCGGYARRAKCSCPPARVASVGARRRCPAHWLLLFR